MAKSDWLEFELSVKKFIEALDPHASVTHDARLPDVHTGSPRQRDIIIEAKICNHYTVKVLVSCKRYVRPVNIQHIDAFNGELISSSAHKGVIYSYSGFTKNAIKKCQALGISCCQLFQNKTGTIPATLTLFNTFCCSIKAVMEVFKPLDPEWRIHQWKDLYALKNPGDSETMLDSLVVAFDKCEKVSLADKNSRSFPEPKGMSFKLENSDPSIGALEFQIRCLWRVYRGEWDASLINGSYSFSENVFAGTQASPIIDTQSGTQGKGWTLLSEVPESIGDNSMLIILHGTKIRAGLLSIANKNVNAVSKPDGS